MRPFQTKFYSVTTPNKAIEILSKLLNENVGRLI